MTARYECARRKSTDACARIATPRFNRQSLETTEKVQRSRTSLCIMRTLNGTQKDHNRDTTSTGSRASSSCFDSPLVRCGKKESPIGCRFGTGASAGGRFVIFRASSVSISYRRLIVGKFVSRNACPELQRGQSWHLRSHTSGPKSPPSNSSACS